MNKRLDVVIDTPLNQPMDELFAIIAKDENGNEGIMSYNGKPIVFGQMDNLQSALENFSRIAKACNKKIQLCRYKRTEIIREA